MSEEDTSETFLEQGFNLESPEADRVINFGTAAPVWQNTTEPSEDFEPASSEQGQEVVMRAENRRSSSTVSDASSSKSISNDPKKMSYMQMAKMGYQELVNAIIRPPRADYKVNGYDAPFYDTDYRMRLFSWIGQSFIHSFSFLIRWNNSVLLHSTFVVNDLRVRTLRSEPSAATTLNAPIGNLWNARPIGFLCLCICMEIQAPE